MALFGRIVVMLFALWLATMAAGLVWSAGLLSAQSPAMTADPMDHVIFWGAAFIATGVTAVLLFVPTLIAVGLAEAFSLRSALVYTIGGAVLSLLAFYGAGFGRPYQESIDRPPPPLTRAAEVAAAAGAAFGFVYWAIAGRRAGMWRRG